MTDIYNMNESLKRQLVEFLLKYITPNKRTKFKEVLNQRTRHITVVLEDLYQSHNASAVLRTCDCTGIQDVHIIENRNLYKVSKDVALGSSKWLDLHKYNEQTHNTTAAFEQLRKKGYRIIATSPHRDDINLYDLDVNEKTALVFGTELEGLSETALEGADGYLRIPMYGFTESYNISVSAAIVLSHLSHKLRGSEINWQLSEEEKTDLKLNWSLKVLKKRENYVKQFLRDQTKSK